MDIFVFSVSLGVFPMFVSLGSVRTSSSAAIARFTGLFTLLPFLPATFLPVTYDPARVTGITIRRAHEDVAALAIMSAYSVNFFRNVRHFLKLYVACTDLKLMDWWPRYDKPVSAWR